jgi:hypothetical protein
MTPTLTRRKQALGPGMHVRPSGSATDLALLDLSSETAPQPFSTSSSAKTTSSSQRLSAPDETQQDLLGPLLSQQQVEHRIRRLMYRSLAPELAKTALNNLAACFIQVGRSTYGVYLFV